MSSSLLPSSSNPARAQPLDWLLLAALTGIGGFSFAFIRMAVSTMPPAAIAVGRLWVGAAFLYAVMRLAGRRFPPIIARTEAGWRLEPSWIAMMSVGAIGYVVPFLIFPWAQQFVESGLAGVYMAFMPIWTLGLAYVFAGEALTPGKLAGFTLGFAGVAVLMGADALSGAAQSSLFAQAGLLLATLCYAVSAIVTRRAPPILPRVFAAGTVLVAAIMASPALFFIQLDTDQWALSSLLSVFALGVGPTGISGLFIIIVVKRAGAGFMSLANYMTPIVAVAIGALLFHERLGPNVLVALCLILSGVAISQRWRMRPQTKIAP